MVHTCVFQEKFVIFLGNMQETNALEANIGSFDKISVKYLPSHTQALVSWPKICLKLRCTPISIKEILKLW